MVLQVITLVIQFLLGLVGLLLVLNMMTTMVRIQVQHIYLT